MEVYEDRVPEAYEIAHWSVKLEASEAEQNYTGTFNLRFLAGIVSCSKPTHCRVQTLPYRSSAPCYMHIHTNEEWGLDLHQLPYINRTHYDQSPSDNALQLEPEHSINVKNYGSSDKCQLIPQFLPKCYCTISIRNKGIKSISKHL